MRGDPWLGRWLPLIAERAGADPVLELGCGAGRDTATLIDAGLSVVALDISPALVAEARLRCPGAELHCQDLIAPFPVRRAGAIVASLSLHYFGWDETAALAARIRDTLRPGGVLVCRLNSTKDHHYGASGHTRIKDDFYLVEGEPKRFFDERAVRRLFGKGWTILSLGEFTVDRYEHPKVLWEVVLEA
jgi:SAM-dependent methyltransferase